MNKFLKIENSKNDLHKAQGTFTNKKNDPGEAIGNMIRVKKKGMEMRNKLKAQRNIGIG